MTPIERTKRVHMLFSTDEYGMVSDLAESAGVTVSDYVRMAVRRDHAAKFEDAALRRWVLENLKVRVEQTAVELLQLVPRHLSEDIQPGNPLSNRIYRALTRLELEGLASGDTIHFVVTDKGRAARGF